MKTFIPFDGFYNSVHDAAIDYALSSMFQDENGDETPIAHYVYGITRKHGAQNAPHWQQVWNLYAAAFVEYFSDEYDIPLKFAELNSPREYNFTTDRVECVISRATVRALWRKVDRARLTEVCAERHTSRSGFISFYSPDFTTWGSVDKWDANQVESLIIASIDEDYRDNESSWADDLSCNAEAEDWIYKAAAPGFLRLLKLSDYLRTRAARK